MKTRLYFAAALAAAGCATAAPERVNESLAAKLETMRPTGDKEACLNLTRISSIQGVDERTLLVRTGVNDYYVNRTNGRCSGVTSTFNRIQYKTTTTQLCRGEIISVVDNQSGFNTGSCSFGTFERLEPKAAT